MSDESVGYYWSQAAKEREAFERHEIEHDGDPINWCEECSICMDRVEADIKHKEDLALDRAIDLNHQDALQLNKEAKNVNV